MKNKKIGIFGGTFDPIHKGHINAALFFKNALELDNVLIIPAFVPPHKEYNSDTWQNLLFQTWKVLKFVILR